LNDLANYHPSERVVTGHWEKAFYQLAEPENYGAYYAFECTPGGDVDLSALTPVQLDSWRRAHDPAKYRRGVVRSYETAYRAPAWGECQCGESVQLSDPLWNACRCGRYYNMSGQAVKSPDQYMDEDYPETGESVFDIYNNREDDW
jgi:hypothetical protein